MQEVKDRVERDVPSQEEAVKLLRGYTNRRIIQQNAMVQVLHNITQCLEALPPSEKRDFVKADFERRLNEFVGEGKGRDAQVTQALAELMVQFPVSEVREDGTQALEASGDEKSGETTSPEAETKEPEAVQPEVSDEEVKEAEANAEVSDELENDAQAESGNDETVADEIDEIVEDEAATVS